MDARLEFDLSILVDGVPVAGHATMRGYLEVRMTAPYECVAERHYGFFNRPPQSDGGIRGHAAALLRREYTRLAAEEAEKAGRSREEWLAAAAEAKRGMAAVNMKIQMIRRMTMGAALEDLKAGRIATAEYVRMLRPYKERIRGETAKLARLAAIRRKALRYAGDVS